MFVGTRRSYIHSTARQAHRKRPDTGRAGQGRAGHTLGQASAHAEHKGSSHKRAGHQEWAGQLGCGEVTCRSCSMDWPTSGPMRCSFSSCCSKATGCLRCVSDSLSSLYRSITCSIAGTVACAKPSLWHSHKQTDRQTDRQTDERTQTDRHRQTDTGKDIHKNCNFQACDATTWVIAYHELTACCCRTRRRHAGHSKERTALTWHADSLQLSQKDGQHCVSGPHMLPSLQCLQGFQPALTVVISPCIMFSTLSMGVSASKSVRWISNLSFMTALRFCESLWASCSSLSCSACMQAESCSSAWLRLYTQTDTTSARANRSLCCPVLCCAVLCGAMLCFAVSCHAMLEVLPCCDTAAGGAAGMLCV